MPIGDDHAGEGRQIRCDKVRADLRSLEVVRPGAAGENQNRVEPRLAAAGDVGVQVVADHADPPIGRQPIPGQVEDEPMRLADRDTAYAGRVLDPARIAPVAGQRPSGIGNVASRPAA